MEKYQENETVLKVGEISDVDRHRTLSGRQKEIKSLLIKAPDDLRLPESQLGIVRRAVSLFLPILHEWMAECKALNEGILERFLSYLKQKGYAPGASEKYVSGVRFVFNHYLFPNGVIERPFIDLSSHRKQTRLQNLSPHTQKVLEWYEANAVKIRSAPIYVQAGGTMRKSFELIVTGQSLKTRVKKTRLERLVKFLESVRKTDVREVTAEDCKAYLGRFEKNNQKRTAEKDLTELISVFENLKAAGFIKQNPLFDFQIPRTPSRPVIDFIRQEDMDKLLDLSKVNWDNVIEVRNRMICLLLYDLALRKNELIQIRLGDVKIEDEDHLLVTLRPEIQKGQGKEEVQFFLFFSPTRKVLLHYLRKMRSLLKPKTDSLLIGQRGDDLSDCQMADTVRDTCRRLRISTFNGKIPSPHILRHSFATLNVAPLGLGLPLHEIVDRLRHVGYETAKKHYVHDNYYLKKKKLEQYRQSEDSIFGRFGIQDICTWLKKLNISDQAMSEIVYRYNSFKARGGATGGEWIHENEVLDRLKKFGLLKRAIRSFFRQSRNLREERSRGKGYLRWYPKDMVEEIQSHYETPEVIMRTMNVRKTKFYERVDTFKTLKIGRRLLVRKDSIFQGGTR